MTIFACIVFAGALCLPICFAMLVDTESHALRGCSSRCVWDARQNVSLFTEPPGSHVVLPAFKILVCTVPKTASTSTRRFLGHVVALTTSASGRPHLPAAPPLADLDSILADPSWRKIVTLRDPVERFASALLASLPTSGLRRTPNANSYALHTSAAELRLSSLESAGGPATVHDPHFRPAASFCGLGRGTLSAFSVIPFPRLSDGWQEVFASVLPGDAPIARLVSESFSQLRNGASAARGRLRLSGGHAGAVSSAGLARHWRTGAAANSSGREAVLLARLRTFYAADEAMMRKVGGL